MVFVVYLPRMAKNWLELLCEALQKPLNISKTSVGLYDFLYGIEIGIKFPIKYVNLKKVWLSERIVGSILKARVDFIRYILLIKGIWSFGYQYWLNISFFEGRRLCFFTVELLSVLSFSFLGIISIFCFMFDSWLLALGVCRPFGVRHSSSFLALQFERFLGVLSARGDFLSFFEYLLVGVFILLLKEPLFSLSSSTNLGCFLNSRGKLLSRGESVSSWWVKASSQLILSS